MPEAVSCARAYTKAMLRWWGASHLFDDALLVASELVTNAVQATGLNHEPKWMDIKTEHVIGLQLRIVHDSFYVEVWDNSSDAPLVKNPTADAEGGRGLYLVEGLAKRWGAYRPSAGGKIVWAELPLSRRRESLVDSAPPPPHRVPGRFRVPEGPAKEHVETALTQRVLDRLQNAGSAEVRAAEVSDQLSTARSARAPSAVGQRQP
ncbi:MULTISPECIES: ATP-binding protein [unclassified Streptomyces]|uniref:ATP-binding protein n=1 Tax=unclassified Streptomyces TaxID=2593676 RepID=UPI0036578FD7